MDRDRRLYGSALSHCVRLPSCRLCNFNTGRFSARIQALATCPTAEARRLPCRTDHGIAVLQCLSSIQLVLVCLCHTFLGHLHPTMLNIITDCCMTLRCIACDVRIIHRPLWHWAALVVHGIPAQQPTLNRRMCAYISDKRL